ncbi:hypothetical protein GQ55_9G036000 [Panicum hallii var. hallii]|jgi:hypothetical protein|uniref:EF-hand domain-containing protein n=2 Tax=Panicum hallii TaxID=206008 RepID=A0A2T7BZ97_9POAL|nr:probable calcium-binding protein CML21 [Panicum hallii]PAN44356.2 hypothetical protein PAHAL_9G037400 [Panicum hallii]PUZ36414.1 hypothetical protein GQ55_9G036000 [Panicum hallii var. hallii]
MLDLVPTVFDQHGCLIVSVSSFLIMVLLQLQPLVDNFSSARRSIRSASRAVVRLLARDDSVVLGADDDEEDDSGVGGVVAPPRQARRHCERCARRRGASRPDVAAVMARLGLLPGGGVDGAGGGDGGEACGGCEAAWAVDDLLESKVASEAELREAFYVFDRDEDGFVSPSELWNVMRRLGMPEGARPEDCRRMIAAHDADGDGRISFREFRAMMENAV